MHAANGAGRRPAETRSFVGGGHRSIGWRVTAASIVFPAVRWNESGYPSIEIGFGGGGFIRVHPRDSRGKRGIGILQEVAENAEVDSRKDSRSLVTELVERLDLKPLSALRTTRSKRVMDRRHEMRSHPDSSWRHKSRDNW